MQRLCAAFFCLLLLSIGMKDMIVYMVYVANMDYVAERFCQNTDQQTCKGSCYLTEVFGKQNTGKQDIPNLPAPVEKTNFIPTQIHFHEISIIESRLTLSIKQDSILTFLGLAPPTPPPQFFIV